MNFDRGFIKWQPFNSVIPNKTILNQLTKKETNDKPILSPEQLENLNELIKEAYYSKSKIHLCFYEQNRTKTIEATITKINPDSNTIMLNNKKKISFYQIINIK